MPGVLARAVQAARGVPEAKSPPPADEDTPESLAAQLMEDMDQREICRECNGVKVVRIGNGTEIVECASCVGTGWLQ